MNLTLLSRGSSRGTPVVTYGCDAPTCRQTATGSLCTLAASYSWTHQMVGVSLEPEARSLKRRASCREPLPTAVILTTYTHTHTAVGHRLMFLSLTYRDLLPWILPIEAYFLGSYLQGLLHSVLPMGVYFSSCVFPTGAYFLGSYL